MRNKLTLRVKMALWFTGSVLVVTALFFSALYFTTRAKLNGMLRDDLSAVLSGTYDISRIISRISLGTVTPKDLIALKMTLLQ